MAVYRVESLLSDCGEDLAQRSLATTSFPNEQYRLLIQETLVHKDCKSFELLRLNQPGKVEFLRYL
jgi:hypothetical protein